METEKEDYPFKVTREETDRYLREVKDQNPIHQGKVLLFRFSDGE